MDQFAYARIPERTPAQRRERIERGKKLRAERLAQEAEAAAFEAVTVEQHLDRLDEWVEEAKLDFPETPDCDVFHDIAQAYMLSEVPASKLAEVSRVTGVAAPR